MDPGHQTEEVAQRFPSAENNKNTQVRQSTVRDTGDVLGRRMQLDAHDLEHYKEELFCAIIHTSFVLSIVGWYQLI